MKNKSLRMYSYLTVFFLVSFFLVALLPVFSFVYAEAAAVKPEADNRVNAQMLTDAIRRIDGVLANCTGIFRNGESRGLTRVEHEQLKNDVMLVTTALNTLVAAQAKDKAAVVPEVSDTPSTITPPVAEAPAVK